MRNTILEALSDNIVIDKDKCVFCGVCVETCILDNLRLQLAPCRQACPLGVNCHGYVQLILRGRDEAALEMVRRDLPFPGILGRICSADCEQGCHRGRQADQPVAIRALKRFLADQCGGDPLPLPELAPPSGKHCAVVGSGPAGMMAAWDLLVGGHRVTIFDADTEPGGMLRWAIPEFRLPASLVAQEFTRLQAMGAEVVGETRIGTDVTLDQLTADHDAVIVATGCPQAKKLEIPGEESQNVLYALPFLQQIKKGRRPAVGKNTVVIGGGAVAIDAAHSALRLGAEKVVVVSLESPDIMPAGREALDMAEAEGVVLEGSWGPTRILAADGKATAVQLQRCLTVYDAFGRFAPTFDDCTLNEIPADSVIIAVGQAHAPDLFSTPPECDPVTLQTRRERVFIAGDLQSGPATVVAAMASGRRAAESVHRLLTGQHLTYGRRYEGPVEKNFAIDTSRGSAAKRVRPAWSPFGGENDFGEIEQPLTVDQARTEAGRCYSCGSPFGKYRTCWFCLPCEVECPEEALYVDIPYLLR